MTDRWRTSSREGGARHRREQEHRQGHRARGRRERGDDLRDRPLARGRARAAREPAAHGRRRSRRAAARRSPSPATTPTTRRSRPSSTASATSRAGSTSSSTSPRPTSPRWSACRSGRSRSTTSRAASTSVRGPNYVTTALAARMMIDAGLRRRHQHLVARRRELPAVGAVRRRQGARSTRSPGTPRSSCARTASPSCRCGPGSCSPRACSRTPSAAPTTAAATLHGLDVSFGETPKFNGKAVVALAADPTILRADRRFVLVGRARPRVRLHRGRRPPPARDGQRGPRVDGRRHARLSGAASSAPPTL